LSVIWNLWDWILYLTHKFILEYITEYHCIITWYEIKIFWQKKDKTIYLSKNSLKHLLFINEWFSIKSLRFFFYVYQDIAPGSPAAQAQMIAYTDYIIGADSVLHEVWHCKIPYYHSLFVKITYYHSICMDLLFITQLNPIVN
jgi:hypothetical protein